MKILITGSAGFVWKELVRKLQKNHHFIIGIDINKEDQSDLFFQHDLTTPFDHNIEFDLCIHLASSVGWILFNTEKADIIKYNNHLNAIVLQIMKTNSCDRMIFFSSINVFEWKDTFPHARLDSLSQESAYALSKWMSEMFFSSWISHLTVIRPTNIFGQSQMKSHAKFGESHVIPDLLTKIEQAESSIEVFGDGSQVRNFLHVDDITEFLTHILDLNGQHFYNLRSEILITIEQLANELIWFAKKDISIKYLPEFMRYEQMRINNFSLDIVEVLGFNSSVESISKGLTL